MPAQTSTKNPLSLKVLHPLVYPLPDHMRALPTWRSGEHCRLAAADPDSIGEIEGETASSLRVNTGLILCGDVASRE